MPLFRRGGGADGDMVDGAALVLSNDSGFSAMSWWVTTAALSVSTPGEEPIYIEVECTVHRDKSLLAGSVLPVHIDPRAPEHLKIRWEEVPTIEQRIADNDPVILDPEHTWRTVAEARRAAPITGATIAPSPGVDPWGDARIEGWPGDRALGGARRPATALVVASSIDSRGYRAADDWHFPISRYAGTIYDTAHEYLGWLVLCVAPESAPRYGLHVRKMLRSTRLGALLPVTIDPTKPDDIEIAWLHAPDMVRARTKRMLAANESAVEMADKTHEAQAAAGEAALGAIEDAGVRAQAEEMLKRFGMAGGEPGGSN